MATYKVIQDIEAEDKLLGPFGLRQFIYLIIVAVSGFVMFRIFISPAWFLAFAFLPHTLFFALLALPIGGEQPTETWLLAKIRFALKPRRRIWDQSGIQNLVTITAPKKEEKVLMHDMSEGEIRSRLEALANTIDSRGWAIKNVNVNMFTPAYAGGTGQSSDRLLDIGAVQQVPDYDITAIDDMMDEQNNPRAQNLDRLINASSQAHREQIISSMKSTPLQSQLTPVATSQPSASTPAAPATPQTDYWFLSQSSASSAGVSGFSGSPASTIVAPDSTAVQQQTQSLPPTPLAPHIDPLTKEGLDKTHTEKEIGPKHHGNIKVIKTLDEQAEEERLAKLETTQSTITQIPEPPMTPETDPDIINLARNDDLNVETVARQAKKSKQQDLPDGEVVINLH